jgi:hypothetical protein
MDSFSLEFSDSDTEQDYYQVGGAITDPPIYLKVDDEALNNFESFSEINEDTMISTDNLIQNFENTNYYRDNIYINAMGVDIGLPYHIYIYNSNTNLEIALFCLRDIYKDIKNGHTYVIYQGDNKPNIGNINSEEIMDILSNDTNFGDYLNQLIKRYLLISGKFFDIKDFSSISNILNMSLSNIYDGY